MSSPLPSVLSEDERSDILEAPDIANPSDERNKLMMEVMLKSGLRPGEVCGLQEDHVRFYDEEGEKQGSYLDIPSSGQNISRSIEFSQLPDGCQLWSTLERWWIETRESLPAAMRKSDYFFATHQGNPVQKRHLRKKIKRYANDAGIQKDVSPFTLRHTFAVSFYEETEDLAELQEILGLQNRYTVSKYKK